MKIAIIINASRSSSSLLDDINSALIEQGLQADIFTPQPPDIFDLLVSLKLKSYNAFVIGGGDGTVRTITEIFKDTDMPLAILPLGTFNVLANELNHSTDVRALLDMIKTNKVKKIDVAEVNGQFFLNHSWIGFYSKILKLREKHKSFLGTNKLLKILFMTFNLFKPIPFYKLEMTTDTKTILYNTCLVYVGNNDHHVNFLNFGEKKILSSGLLSINILNCKSRWEMAKCAFSILFNQFKNSKYVTQFTTERITITSKNTLANIVVDGDLLKTETPLKYCIHKKKLTVFIP